MENKNKRFNDRVRLIISRKEIEEGQKRKYVNVKINDVRGSLNKFTHFFRLGTFIDNTHKKL